MSDLVNSGEAGAVVRNLPPDVQKALGSCFGLVELAQAIQVVLNDPEVRRQVVVARTIIAMVNDPDSGLQQQLRSHAEGFRQVHAALNGFFHSPEASQIARLLRLLVERADRKPFSAFPAHFERAQRNLADMADVAFIRTGDESGSLAGFLEVQAMGSALQAEDGFAPAISDALRQDLGDARPMEIVPSGLSYRFDGTLTCFPRATFDLGLQRAGLLDGAEALLRQYGASLQVDPAGGHGLGLNARLYSVLYCLEQAIRDFLDRKMVETYGPKWAKSRAPNGMLDGWKDTQGSQSGPVICYAEFSDYTKIITRTDNWRDLFSRYFHRVEDVRESFERLRAIRNTTMHSRAATQEDELTVACEVTRLLNAMSRTPS